MYEHIDYKYVRTTNQTIFYFIKPRVMETGVFVSLVLLLFFLLTFN